MVQNNEVKTSEPPHPLLLAEIISTFLIRFSALKAAPLQLRCQNGSTVYQPGRSSEPQHRGVVRQILKAIF